MQAKLTSVDVDTFSGKNVLEIKIKAINVSETYTHYLLDLLRHGEDVIIVEKILTEQD